MTTPMQIDAASYAAADLTVTAGAGWTPASLTGLVAWYDASNAASITASAGNVSQWSDLSGAANHATQATGGSQPKTGTKTIGGKNAIEFVWSQNMGTALSATVMPRFIAAVVNHGELNTSLITPSAADGVEWRLASNGSGTYEILEAGVAHHGFSTAVSSATVSRQVAVQVATGATAFYRSSTTDGTNADAYAFSGAATVIIGGGGAGGGNAFGGSSVTSYVGEIVIVNGTPTGGDRTSLFGYFLAKWGV